MGFAALFPTSIEEHSFFPVQIPNALISMFYFSCYSVWLVLESVRDTMHAG